MNKIIKLGIMITLSISTLAGCGNNVGTAPNGGFALRADNATFMTGFRAGGMKGFKGGPVGAFGLPAELNLTADQKAQLEALRPAAPAKPDKATMEANRAAAEALRKEINDAFISDNFDAASLKAKQEALKSAKPNNDEHITAEATRIVKTYNILTAEQRALLETKQKEMADKIQKMPAMPKPPANVGPAKMADAKIDKLATALGLSDAQKASLKSVFAPPTNIVKPDFQAEQAKRKAEQDAINAALKAGNATVESIAAILKANAPTEFKHIEGNEIDRLASIHAILNADQRKKFIESNKGFGFGPGGHGKPGGFHGGPGGPGGFGKFAGHGHK